MKPLKQAKSPNASRRLFRIRAVAASVLLAFSLLPAGLTSLHAGAMEDFFNDAGAVASASGGGSVHGQAMNTYSGGSLFVRVPQKNYQLLSVSPPKLSQGCGGIDIYTGSFSHINKAAFVAMLKNIGQNALGQAFSLALTSLAPEVNSVMQYMQSIAQTVNGANINSCETGTNLANSALGGWMADHQRTAWKWGFNNGGGADAADVRDQTATSETQVWANLQSARTSTPGYQPPTGMASSPAIASGNVVWRALTQSAVGMDGEMKTILMNLVGTVVFDDSNANDPKISVYMPKLSLKDLMGADTGPTTLEAYVCSEGILATDDQCRTPTLNPNYTFDGFTSIVNSRMAAIQGRMQNRIAQTNADLNFTEVVTIPIQRILSIGVIGRAPQIAVQMQQQYNEIISAEYALAFIMRGLKTLESAIGQAKKNVSSEEAKTLDDLLQKSLHIRAEAQTQLRTAYQKTGQLQSIASQLEAMERTMYGNMSSSLQSAMSFERTRAGR